MDCTQCKKIVVPPDLAHLSLTVLADLVESLVSKNKKNEQWFVALVHTLPQCLLDHLSLALEQSKFQFWLWLLIWSHTSLELSLPEFLHPGHWSTRIFDHISSSSLDLKHTKLTLKTVDSDASRNAFMYELTEDVWKPKLKCVLKKMPGLLEINAISGFIDDDCLADMGRICCNTLSKLTIRNDVLDCPDGQRLTDDGLCDFADYVQAGKLSWLDLGNCNMADFSAKSLLYLNKVSSLLYLHVKANHFGYASMALDLHKDLVSLGNHVTWLSVTFDQFATSTTSLDLVLPYIPVLFPRLSTLELSNVTSTQSLVDSEAVKKMSFVNPSCLDELPRLFPKLTHLSLLETSQKCSLNVDYGSVTTIMIEQGLPLSSIRFAFVCQLLLHCPNLRVLKSKARLSKVSEKQFLDTLEKVTLKDLQVFVLSDSSQMIDLTHVSVEALRRLCPTINNLGDLTTWNVPLVHGHMCAF